MDDKGVSQHQLANQLGIQQAYISLWINKKHSPSMCLSCVSLAALDLLARTAMEKWLTPSITKWLAGKQKGSSSSSSGSKSTRSGKPEETKQKMESDNFHPDRKSDIKPAEKPEPEVASASSPSAVPESPSMSSVSTLMISTSSMSDTASQMETDSVAAPPSPASQATALDHDSSTESQSQSQSQEAEPHGQPDSMALAQLAEVAVP